MAEKKKFDKQVLTRFVQNECERQLFLDISQSHPELWRFPNRKLENPKRVRRSSENLEELGRRYEQQVYRKLIKTFNTRCNFDKNGAVGRSSLTSSELLEIYARLEEGSINSIYLFEYEYQIPSKFFRDWFFPYEKTIPFDYGRQRPDILIIRKENASNLPLMQLESNGSLKELSTAEIEHKYCISIIDIKNIRNENIGKKQFIEILYYMLSIVQFLEKNNLDDKFFVNPYGNGIFFRIAEDDLNKIEKEKKFEIIEVKWEEAGLIFHEVVSRIRKLWKNHPKPIKSVAVNVSAHCGYCYFIEDCKKTLGMTEDTIPNDWSLTLIPNVSTSIAQQLFKLGFFTIGDITNNIKSINIGDTPKPIYPELPLLELKARAMIENKVIHPPPGKIHAYSIPKYSTIGVTFAIETDPANQRVYAAGLFLFISIPTKAPFRRIYDNWWRIWKNKFESEITDKAIQEELNEYLLHEIPLHVVKSFREHMDNLKLIQIYCTGDLKSDGSPRTQTVIIYQFANINESDSDETEAEFVKKIIVKLYNILEMCNIIENYVVIDAKEAGKYIGPATSIFYWSKRQLENFQEMLERNLNYIIRNPEVARAFEGILSLFTPSDSEVAHPYQHKKLFNVQDFAETILGFPNIISYTWHEIATDLLQRTTVSPRYWIPHFNYMDFNNWYEYLLENDDPKKKQKKKEEIKKQIISKARIINSLRIHFQQRYSKVISKNVRIINKTQFNSIFLSPEFHPIAQIWYLFSKYTGAMEEMETEYFRITFPEYSIGKLAVAEVEDLEIITPKINKVVCKFKLIGLSSNVNFNEGDRVYLLPNKERDTSSIYKLELWKIIIKEMVWDTKTNGYWVISEEKSSKLLAEYQGIENNFDWFLYPTSLDVWSNKLYGRNGLLERNNIGKSWLGFRLSYLWGIRSKQEINWPISWQFSAPSVYLYLPELLINLREDNDMKLDKKLLTPIQTVPDSSQVIAINNSLNRVISGVQGPPGTGKSQTIAALIDEYVEREKLRGKKSIKILISCFSYAALRVVLDKIRKSKDNDGNLTESAQMQYIFLRSEYQKKIESESGYREVDDLLRKGRTWKLNGKSRTVTSKITLEESLEERVIIFANAHQLYHLVERVKSEFAFDLIIVDEASQVPLDYFLSCLQFIKKPKFKIKPVSNKLGEKINDLNSIQKLILEEKVDIKDLTKVIIVGDNYQLPPVQPVQPPKNLTKILDSLFTYYVRHHGISNVQLKHNYRSNKDIVDYTSSLEIYKELKPAKENKDRKVEGQLKLIKNAWIREVLDYEKIVSVIIHNKNFEIGVSSFEANLVNKIVINFFKMLNIKSKQEELTFWTEKLGVVAPHNAQGRLIIRKIFNSLTDLKNRRTFLSNSELMRYLRNTVYSVEKFQGSDRELIISSIGLSDPDQLEAESEFIYSLNRFNVLTSRAKSKLILILSEKFLNFIPSERDIMSQAAQIRMYAYEFCNKEKNLSIKNDDGEIENIIFRYKN